MAARKKGSFILAVLGPTRVASHVDNFEDAPFSVLVLARDDDDDDVKSSSPLLCILLSPVACGDKRTKTRDNTCTWSSYDSGVIEASERNDTHAERSEAHVQDDASCAAAV